MIFRLSDRYLDENWRTGRKMSICDSDDGRQTPNISSHSISLSNTLSTHQTSPSGYTSSQPPGVLVLPDTSQSPPSHPVSRQQGTQQQRTLFDPNNPNKPIVITSPSSRAVVQRYKYIKKYLFFFIELFINVKKKLIDPFALLLEKLKQYLKVRLYQCFNPMEVLLLLIIVFREHI